MTRGALSPGLRVWCDESHARVNKSDDVHDRDDRTARRAQPCKLRAPRYVLDGQLSAPPFQQAVHERLAEALASGAGTPAALAAARELFATQVQLGDEAEAQRQCEAGVCVRVTEPRDILERLCAQRIAEE